MKSNENAFNKSSYTLGFSQIWTAWKILGPCPVKEAEQLGKQ